MKLDVQGKMKILQLEEEADELMKACDALQGEAEQHTEEILQLRTRLRIMEVQLCCSSFSNLVSPLFMKTTCLPAH